MSWVNKNIGWVLAGTAVVVGGAILLMKAPAAAASPLVPPAIPPATPPVPGPIVIPSGQTPTVVTLVPERTS